MFFSHFALPVSTHHSTLSFFLKGLYFHPTLHYCNAYSQWQPLPDECLVGPNCPTPDPMPQPTSPTTPMPVLPAGPSGMWYTMLFTSFALDIPTLITPPSERLNPSNYLQKFQSLILSLQNQIILQQVCDISSMRVYAIQVSIFLLDE